MEASLRYYVEHNTGRIRGSGFVHAPVILSEADTKAVGHDIVGGIGLSEILAPSPLGSFLESNTTTGD